MSSDIVIDNNKMIYSKKAIKYFRNPKYAYEMDNPDSVGQVGNVTCGDIMKVFLKIKDDVIIDISFLTYGCIGAIASSEAMCKLVKGKSIENALKVTNQDIINELDGLPDIKIHCSVLGKQALVKAINNYKKRR